MNYSKKFKKVRTTYKIKLGRKFVCRKVKDYYDRSDTDKRRRLFKKRTVNGHQTHISGTV